MPQSKPLVVVTRVLPGELSLPQAEVRVLGDGLPDRAEVLRAIAGARVVVTMFTDRVDVEFLDAAGSGLRGVCNMAVGYDNIDLAECALREITVTNTPHAVTEGTADLAWALILAVARRLVEADAYVRGGCFTRQLGMAEMLGADLTGRTLLIVGAGRIGRAVALRSLGWGMRVLYTDRTRQWEMELAPLSACRVELEEGLAEADVISLHTPLTEETRRLIDAGRLALMKPTAILINTSRGAVVDEAALVDALRARRIFGAGLDVYQHEPRIHRGLAELDNVVLTPHIGSAERRYREMMTRMVQENAEAILDGRTPPNPVGR